MSVLFAFPLIWSQAAAPMPGAAPPAWLQQALAWLFLFGEPAVTQPGLIGAAIEWLKVVSLICLFGWVVSWLTAALKERTVARGSWLDFAALAAGAGFVGSVLLRVLEENKRIDAHEVAGIALSSFLGALCGLLVFLWVEWGLWRTIRRLGRWPDLLVLLGIHLGMALGIGVGIMLQRVGILYGILQIDPTKVVLTWRDGLVYGVRLSATYMGYAVLLRVLGIVVLELLAVRARRLYSIASVSVLEAHRRMWAPWVVIAVFLVVLAFTHWFLIPPRAAEMGRLFVGTLLLLCSLLLTVMVTLLTPLSLPTDIQQQTIYTIVSKPVRRVELIWGRMIGFMTIVSLLVVVFGLISLGYLWRTVNGTINATVAEAVKAEKAGRGGQARLLREQADQLRTRMAARVPVRGFLTFIDSKGTAHLKGIDVGQEQSMREPRSHIEGGTPAAAIWTYGRFRNPNPNAANPEIDRRIPVRSLLRADSIEGLLNTIYELRFQIAAAERETAAPNLPPARASQLTAGISRNKAELDRVREAHKGLVTEATASEARAKEAEAAGRATQAQVIRREAQALHSPRVPLEMTFNVYRTTKGRIGEPVYAKIEVSNPQTGASYTDIFPIREYYTNKQFVPAEILAGSLGALKIQVHCLSATQYLGMAESDLYVLAQSGNFGSNFMKGLFGVWLQAMVLTAIGVFAGTFLSWPVALLTTIAFAVGGHVFFSYLLQFAHSAVLGGGPFESLIRLLTHDNQMSELSPTLAVLTAKTFDSLVMPIMSRLVYVVPNFSAFDVSNTVSNGFAVRWAHMGGNLLLALAYALPFSIAGYFILKNREVAA